MRMNGIILKPARVLVFAVSLFLASCVELTSPLSDPDAAKPDERLYGAWKASGKGSNASQYWFIFIGKPSQHHVPSGIMKSIDVSNNPGNRLDVKESWSFFSSSLGQATYANLFDPDVLDRAKFPRWDKRNIKDYAILKYAVENDRLTLWTMDSNAAAEAIKKGHLKGKIEKRGLLEIEVVTLTASEDLSKYLSSGGDKLLFPDKDKTKFVFSRVK